MTDCTGCGHDLGNDRFCTQCGRPASRPAPAMSAVTTRTDTPPRTPPPAAARRPARFPLYAEHPGDESVGQHSGPTEPPPDARLSETAVGPLGRPPAAVPVPEPEERLPLSERIADRVASSDPTWLTSFGVLAGVLLGVFILGLILVII